MPCRSGRACISCRDAKNQVIYVGKAKALKNRVSQYFANLAATRRMTRAMVSQIDHFDVIVADSELRALVLENSLIKRHQPRTTSCSRMIRDIPISA